MALIRCTECGKEISDQVAVCPNCGCPIRLYAIGGQAPVLSGTAHQTLPMQQMQQGAVQPQKKAKKKTSSLSSAAGALTFTVILLVAITVALVMSGHIMGSIVLIFVPILALLAVIFALIDLLFYFKGQKHFGSWITVLIVAVCAVILFVPQQYFPPQIRELLQNIF